MDHHHHGSPTPRSGSPRSDAPSFINKLFKMKSTTAPVTSRRTRRKSVEINSSGSVYSSVLDTNIKMYVR